MWAGQEETREAKAEMGGQVLRGCAWVYVDVGRGRFRPPSTCCFLHCKNCSVNVN